jgi:hypothetical protein
MGTPFRMTRKYLILNSASFQTYPAIILSKYEDFSLCIGVTDRYLFPAFHKAHVIKGDDDMAPKKQEPATEPKYPVIVKDPGMQRYNENGPNTPLSIEGVVVDKSLRDKKFKGTTSWEEDKVYDLGVNPETGQVGFNPSRPMKPGTYSVSIESHDPTGPTTSAKFEVQPYGSGKKK